jgi:hypothetical protein
VHQRVVENEESVVAPVVPLVSDFDIDLVARDRVDVLEQSQSEPHRPKVFVRGFSAIENRNADRANVLVVPVKLGEIEDSVEVTAVPLEKNHFAVVVFEFVLKLGGKVFLIDRLEQRFDLGLVRRRQILELVHAFVPVRQRQKIDEKVERRQVPGERAVAQKILFHQFEIEIFVSDDVEHAADEIKS